MNTANLLRLISLAAIWGGSFLFMRISAPTLGPAVLIEFRVLLAALFLAAVGFVLKKRLLLREHWKHYFILGFFNSALPFLLFAYGAQVLSAGLESVLNATAPMWGALVGALWTRKPVPLRTMLGLVLGTLGVALLVGFDTVSARPGATLAVVAALAAALCYGIASQYARAAKSVEPFANAHGTMWSSAIMVLPVLPFFPAHGAPTPAIAGAVLALGVLCSGIAYLIYFRLIQEVGSASALTVTFLNPIFGILWGVLFLGETIGWYTLVGAPIVLLGTALVTGFVPSFKRGGAQAGAR